MDRPGTVGAWLAPAPPWDDPREHPGRRWTRFDSLGGVAGPFGAPATERPARLAARWIGRLGWGVSNTPPQETTQGTGDGGPGRPVPRLVGARCDALVIAYRVEIGPELASYIENRAALAKDFGRVEFVRCLDQHELRMELRRTRAPDRFYLSNVDARVIIDLAAPGAKRRDGENVPAWSVEVTLRATTIAQLGVVEAVKQANAIATAIAGDRLLVRGARLRRFDLAADFERWGPMNEINAGDFVKPGRAKVGEFAKIRTYTTSRQVVTGFTVAAGAPVMARIYDKTAELIAQGDEYKREVEAAQWKAHGWKGGNVVRVEFQLRGEALDDLEREAGGLRDPSKLAEHLDPVWRYCTERWLRLVAPETATRLSRAHVDPRWIAVQAVRFVRDDAPQAIRARVRGGATLGGALGSVVSMLASRAMLPRPALERLGQVGLDAREVVADLTDEEVDVALREQLDDVASKLYAAALVEMRRRARHELARITEQVKASRARFTGKLPPGG